MVTTILEIHCLYIIIGFKFDDNRNDIFMKFWNMIICKNVILDIFRWCCCDSQTRKMSVLPWSSITSENQPCYFRYAWWSMKSLFQFGLISVHPVNVNICIWWVGKERMMPSKRYIYFDNMIMKWISFHYELNYEYYNLNTYFAKYVNIIITYD